jgi:hypothetical protein
LRCKEIWVAGANRYRNPDEDLPADFEENCSAYYQALNLPVDADSFIAELQTEMRQALTKLDIGFKIPRLNSIKGAIQTRNALRSLDPELRKRIHVIAVAPAAFIDKELCRSFVHFVSKSDPIPWIDFIGRMRNKDTVVVLDREILRKVILTILLRVRLISVALALFLSKIK